MVRHRNEIPTIALALVIQAFFPMVFGDCQGRCVPLSQCSNHFGGMPFFRFGCFDDHNCEHYWETCCELENIIDDTLIELTTSGNLITQKPASFDECGKRNRNGVGFTITNAHGGESEFAEFPWMVALFIENESDLGTTDKTYICGGSLIMPNVVMTAAHCVFNRTDQQLIARAGEWDTKTELEPRPYQEQRVSSVIVHEKFNRFFLFNDVALVILEDSFQPDTNVQLICLPEQNVSDDDGEEQECFATGWGKDRFDAAERQVILKKVGLPIVAHSTCQNAMRTTRLGRSFELHETFLCAGGEAEVDTCIDDGGSPLVCPIPGQVDRYRQVGIVAWGIGCGEEGVPGVYVKSGLYIEWIHSKLQGFNVRMVDD